MFVLMLLLILLGIVWLMLFLFFLVSKFLSLAEDSNFPFECGFNCLYPSYSSFSVQFFLIGVLFLVFDVEVVLVLCFPIVSLKLMAFSVSVIVVFSFLVGGLLYEWGSGALSWF